MVKSITDKLDGPLPYMYKLHATGLKPLELKLSVILLEGCDIDLPYILVRPWHPGSLILPAGDGRGVMQKLEGKLAEPFSALLLERLDRDEYKRIASDSVIAPCNWDLASVVDINLLALQII